MVGHPTFTKYTHVQGCQEKSGGPGQKEQVGPPPNWLVSVWYTCRYIDSVQSTLSMRSMLVLGGSGGMPPQENFEIYS